jgi:hypothetical protein
MTHRRYTLPATIAICAALIAAGVGLSTVKSAPEPVCDALLVQPGNGELPPLLTAEQAEECAG